MQAAKRLVNPRLGLGGMQRIPHRLPRLVFCPPFLHARLDGLPVLDIPEGGGPHSIEKHIRVLNPVHSPHQRGLRQRVGGIIPQAGQCLHVNPVIQPRLELGALHHLNHPHLRRSVTHLRHRPQVIPETDARISNPRIQHGGPLLHQRLKPECQNRLRLPGIHGIKKLIQGTHRLPLNHAGPLQQIHPAAQPHKIILPQIRHQALGHLPASQQPPEIRRNILRVIPVVRHIRRLPEHGKRPHARIQPPVMLRPHPLPVLVPPLRARHAGNHIRRIRITHRIQRPETGREIILHAGEGNARHLLVQLPDLIPLGLQQLPQPIAMPSSPTYSRKAEITSGVYPCCFIISR